MTDFPQIINTEIINTETDVFWHMNFNLPGDALPKKVLILSRPFPENSAEELQLNKILSACKLTNDVYNIIQLAENKQTAWHQLKNILQPSVVILFGVHPNDLGISSLFRLNSINNFDNASWIPALSLPEMEQHPQAKKDLWTNALKPLFADNQ